MQKIKVMAIFGTRPEAIKMAPLILELKKQNAYFETNVVVTAQHREMLDSVLDIFQIVPDYDLNIMKRNQTLSGITSSVILDLDVVLEKEKPQIVLVHGDTTTTFAAALSAFYHQIAVGHVEAGLRTWNKYSPWPEEMNRQMTDNLADLYFAPTAQSQTNLLKENHLQQNIFITGNTAIDALAKTVQADYHHQVLDLIDPQQRMILVTMHRRENQGEPMQQVFKAIRDVVHAYSDVEVIYPVHLNPVVQKTAQEILGNQNRIHLIEPLDVLDFHNLIDRSYFIMSDSGGVQEEAPALKKPVLVLRDTTERPEGVLAGTLKLVGTKYEKVKKEMEQLLNDSDEYHSMAQAKNPYGDGKASQRICAALRYYFNQTKQRPIDFK